MNKSEQTLVSVIVVAFQSERFILDTLESIRLQTWENIELIITDDASTDKTVQISNDWISQNKNRFINTKLITVAENTGIPANCDRGFSVAQGAWIKFIGADDLLLPNCISENIRITKDVPEANFIISDLVEIDLKGEVLRESPKNEGLNYFMKNQSSKQKQLKAYARWPAFMNTPTFFYERSLVEDIFKTKQILKIFEDTSSMFTIIGKGVRIFYMQKPTVQYRIHYNAISRNIVHNDRREKEAYSIFLKYRKKHLSKLNPIDIGVLYECWLRFKFKGINGHKGIKVLQKLSLFYWYLRINNIKPEYL